MGCKSLHKIYLGTELNVNLKRSDYSFAYRYLPNIIDWTVLFFHDAIEFSDGHLSSQEEIITLYENFRLSINASRPFSRFSRLDLGLGYYQLAQFEETLKMTNLGYQLSGDSEWIGKNEITSIDLKYVWDNTKWSYTYPIRGSRFYLKYKTSPLPDYETNSLSFDGRFYKPLFNGLSLLARNVSGASWGQDNQKFYLGSSPSFYTSDNFNVTQYYQNQDFNEFSLKCPLLLINTLSFFFYNLIQEGIQLEIK